MDVTRIVIEITAEGTTTAMTALTAGMDRHAVTEVALLGVTRLLDALDTMMMTAVGMIGLLVTQTEIVEELAMAMEIIEKTGTMIEIEIVLDDTETMDTAAARLIHLDTTVTVILIAAGGMIKLVKHASSWPRLTIWHSRLRGWE